MGEVMRDLKLLRGATFGHWPEEQCAECAKRGVTVKYRGPLMPADQISWFIVILQFLRIRSPKPSEWCFCDNCWNSRLDYYDRHHEPKPFPANRAA